MKDNRIELDGCSQVGRPMRPSARARSSTREFNFTRTRRRTHGRTGSRRWQMQTHSHARVFDRWPAASCAPIIFGRDCACATQRTHANTRPNTHTFACLLARHILASARALRKHSAQDGWRRCCADTDTVVVVGGGGRVTNSSRLTSHRCFYLRARVRVCFVGNASCKCVTHSHTQKTADHFATFKSLPRGSDSAQRARDGAHSPAAAECRRWRALQTRCR